LSSQSSIFKAIEDEKILWIVKTACLGVSAILFLSLIFHELKSIYYEGFKEYVKDEWNWFDLMHIMFFGAYVVMWALLFETDNPIMIVNRIIVIAMMFFKLNFYLRIFESFSFIVSMLYGVFFEIWPFLMYFLIVVNFLGMMIAQIMPENFEYYDRMWFFAYPFIAFRIATGQFQIEDYLHPESLATFLAMWGMWLLIFIVGTIIFLNFLVAVVSESYEKCMQTQVA
jgi:hypothetical protein